MASNYTHLEQDVAALNTSGDDLPTYDDLAQQNGPNSRFGRWRGWIEKRAAERYNDISAEDRARQRERGWDLQQANGSQTATLNVPTIVNQPATPGLHIDSYYYTGDADNANDNYPDYDILPEPSPPLVPLPSVIQDISPSHMKLKQFGSRFLPHTTSPIRCLLPLPSHKLVLIGHDEGLSVLDMFPSEVMEDGEMIEKGPDEAQVRTIWIGEGVLQMTILEVESAGPTSAQGVVLALVAPEPESPSKEGESPRTLRMYNLTSLISLAKWSVGQKISKPLDLKRPTNWNVQQSPSKKHRPQSSITRGLKSLIDSPSLHPESTGSYQNLLSRTTSALSNLSVDNLHSNRGSPSPHPHPHRMNSDESSWDIVDDIPLRWATDFVPLAAQGSRLFNAPIISYAVWNDRSRKDGQLLAVATKSNIFLYETPRNERAFRFVKEFYTPLHPRSITFFHQSVNEVSRSSSTVQPPSQTLRAEPSSRSSRRKSASFAPSALDYGPQLSLFVIFEKKATWIRLADAAVGELELFDDGTIPYPSNSPAASSRRSIRVSLSDGGPNYGRWIPPCPCEIPMPPNDRHPAGYTKKGIILTRGRISHILPSPLPAGGCPPLCVVSWKYLPASVTARIHASTRTWDGQPPDIAGSYLQLVALGESGLEVQEIPLSSFGKGKGKGKERSEDPIRAEGDIAGSASFLCRGGHWGNLELRSELQRSLSMASSIQSFDTLETEEMQAVMKREEGIYLSCRRGLEDYRVIWVGGG